MLELIASLNRYARLVSERNDLAAEHFQALLEEHKNVLDFAAAVANKALKFAARQRECGMWSAT